MSEESKSGHSTPRPSSSSGTVKKTDLKSNLRQRNDISKLFAKAPKPKEKLKESPTPQEDGMDCLGLTFFRAADFFTETMQGMSSDEDAEDEASQVDEAKAVAVRKAAEKARKKREENEAKLKAMMEDMDDDGNHHLPYPIFATFLTDVNQTKICQMPLPNPSRTLKTPPSTKHPTHNLLKPKLQSQCRVGGDVGDAG